MPIKQVSFKSAPDQQAIDRQQILAQTMMQRAGQGTPQSWNSMPVVPNGDSQVLPQLISALVGGFAQKNATDKQAALDTKTRSGNDTMIEALTRQANPMMMKRDANNMPMPGTEATRVNEVQSGHPAMSPNGQAMSSVMQGADPAQAKQMLMQAMMSKLMPQAPAPYTLGKNEKRFEGGRMVAENSAPDEPLDPIAKAKADLTAGRLSQAEYDDRVKKLNYMAPPASTNVTLNTDKNLYGTMADKQGAENVSLYQQAQKAPELLQRAQRVKQMLGPGSDAITGAGANWLLQGAKVANSLGFNTGNAAADTEALARDLAAATLDGIKASGLGAGSGFSNADRDFLEKVVGGQITLEAKTLNHLADLNSKTAMSTIERWNATAGRLDPTQLKTLGMSQIEMPKGTPAPSVKPKLMKNPDGSYNYTP